MCQKLETCTPFSIRLAFGTIDECKSRYSVICQGNVPGATGDAVHVSSCANALARATDCDVLFDTTVAGCEAPPGIFVDGQPCEFDVQCHSLFCQRRPSAKCGVCAPAPVAGEVCIGSCGPDLACANGHCVSPASLGARGAPCSITAPCRPTLTCFADTCQQPPRSGESCDSTTPPCDHTRGLTCTSFGLCGEGEIANPGEPCTMVGVPCGGGGRCRMVSGSSSPICVAPVDDGQPCGTFAGRDCKFGSICVHEKCTVDISSLCR